MTSKEHKNQEDSTASLHQKLNNTASTEKTDAETLLEHPDYAELQKKLTEAEEKASQYWDRCLRMQAEAENALRRTERDIANAHKYALDKFLSALLPIIDSFERAVIVHKDDASSIIEGVSLTLQMLYTALEKFGIQQLDPIDQPFNPEFHQAVSTQAALDAKSGTVLNVLQKGYVLNDRLIRPALVVVVKNS